MADAFEIGGLRDLQTTFRELEPALAKALRVELREVAEPVRVGAAENALREVSQIGPVWSEMRVGMSAGVVYVAPKARNRGGSKRKNLGGLLMTAMDEALEAKTPEIVARMELMVDRLIERYS